MRRGNRLNDLIEQRDEVLTFVLKAFFGDTVTRYRIKNREFDLLVVGSEIDKQVVDLVDNFLWTRVVLPWSTWAIIAILRIFAVVIIVTIRCPKANEYNDSLMFELQNNESRASRLIWRSTPF